MAGGRSPITCHVLDSSCGRPGRNVPVKLEQLNPAANNVWTSVAYGLTDADGRVGNLLDPSHQLVAGIYRMTFQTAEYWAANGVKGFYPYVQIIFEVAPGAESQHYHIPLLLSPYSYTTYRGS
ncbi:hypothetical protein DFQ27_000703 [Actinomortierella ambigua]|uniref:5-hydroxyisourate hydrolase n=1 Tax=Actinomortierella ambigua TaxID=1343610 RepID=A0A9P6U8L3_9FUNG|nr:hypothetical protein DFQ27_000703 [Actinomortierella ambigua]